MKCKKHKIKLQLATIDDYMMYPNIKTEYFCLSCVNPLEGLSGLLKEIYSNHPEDLVYAKNPFTSLTEKE